MSWVVANSSAIRTKCDDVTDTEMMWTIDLG